MIKIEGLNQLELVKKDICFFYHESLEYSSLAPDIRSSVSFNEQFHNFLESDADTNKCDSDFINEGCLLILSVLASDILSGASGQWCFEPYEIVRSVSMFKSCNEDLVALRNVVIDLWTSVKNRSGNQTGVNRGMLTDDERSELYLRFVVPHFRKLLSFSDQL